MIALTVVGAPPNRDNRPSVSEPLFGRVARVRALKRGRILWDVLNEAAVILGNPLLMFDVDGKFIACTENVITDDWVWNELIKDGAISDASLRFFCDEGFLDDYSNVRTIALLMSDRIKYGRLLGRIVSRDAIHVASLMMAAVRKPIEAADPAVFEAVCALCTDRACKKPEFLEYGRMHQQSMIATLLSREKLDRRIHSVEASNLYRGFESNLFVAVADAPRGASAKELIRLREQLRHIEPGFKYAVYNRRIVILLSSREPVLVARKDMPRLSRFFEQKNISMGVSGCFENMFELRRYFAEALKALNS